MKHISRLILFVLFATALYGQQTGVNAPATQDSYNNGVYYAPNFGQWTVKLASAIVASSTTVFTTDRGFTTTGDGIIFVPFRANERITIGTGTTAEIATVSSITGCNLLAAPGQPPACSITLTGTTTNAHSVGEPITSADFGVMEAVSLAENSVGPSGTAGGQVYFNVDCGIITLNTGGLTTTSTCFVPNQFFNQGSSSRVSTTITTSASWAVGIVNNTAAFSTANSTLTAGTTAYGFQGTPAVALVTGATTPNLTAVLITAGTSNAGAGAVKTKVWGFVAVQPSF